MTKLFYDHLVKLDQLSKQIAQLELTQQEIQELDQHLDQLIQHHVIEVILDVLHQDHHHLFIARLEQAPHDPDLLTWLKSYIHNIETIISQAISELETQLITELFSSEE